MVSKKILTFLSVFTLLMPYTFALSCNQNFIDNSTEYTSFVSILCPVLRIFNILLYSSGAIFAVYVIYSGIKLSLAWGDPKGFEGAKWSLTYAIIGFVIILAFFVIYRVLLSTLDINSFESTDEITGQVESNIGVFEQFIGK